MAELQQSNLEHFTELVHEIEQQQPLIDSAAIAANLARAKNAIDQLNRLISEKILTNGGSKSKTRRVSWARHKTEIRKIHSALKQYKDNILTATSANILYEFAPKASLVDKADTGARASTNLVNRRLVWQEETSVAVSQQLADIQQSISSTRSTVLSMRYSSNGVQTPLAAQETSRKRPHQDSLNFQDRVKKNRIHEKNAVKPDHDTRNATSSLTLTGASQPASPFERSSSFFPEIYTSDSRFSESRLAVTSSYEESSLNDHRVNFYRFFYVKSPRIWHRLSISISIHRTSCYWTATKISQREFKTADRYANVELCSIPYSLLRKVQIFLDESGSVQQDVHLQLSLSEKNEIQRNQLQAQARRLLEDSQVKLACRNTLSKLDDLGCPRYVEAQVAQIAPIEASSRFISCVEGKLVCEIKSVRPTTSPEFIYNIKVLQCMADVPGFACLRGIVTDAASTHLKSYLIDLPMSDFRPLWKEMGQRKNVPWQCREDWAKQLIEAVRVLHSRGYVVGALSTPEPPIFIDSRKRIQFWSFKDTFSTGDTLGCYYPPEFGYLQTESPATPPENCPKITPKTDIFHLGLLLWFLAENKCFLVQAMFLRYKIAPKLKASKEE
ncbi:hypothetical protein H2200_001366 [Cladophialophora chaetospira]|uniref:Protein kinase domain-containing protein n=1 Tax=Cladophialophora chaetospira TaxID=386627 RepID=A0AA38XKT6_9EURO|nr:hypothetical protein H2200_001366 [Cladophialophora chaetospira]